MRAFKRAQILLKADATPDRPVPIEADIAEAVGVSGGTVVNVCKRYLRSGLKQTLRVSMPGIIHGGWSGPPKHI